MSLWYESMAMDIYDCGNDLPAKAQCILFYLSMPVPRQWWENALSTGRVDPTHAAVLHEYCAELQQILGPQREITEALLIALAFTDKNPQPLVSKGSRAAAIEDYLSCAKKVLAQRPDLRELGKSVEARGGAS